MTRPAPAVPSSLVSDLSRLFDQTLEREDEDGAGTAAGACDCRVVVGEDMYLAHSVLLAARSDFFKAAFSSEMMERNSLMVTLHHGDGPSRESVLAILYFLYTGAKRKQLSIESIELKKTIENQLENQFENQFERHLSLAFCLCS